LSAISNRFGKGKIFYGWWIVAACAILQFWSGAIYFGFSVFFNPIRQTFGWTATSTSVAFTIRGFGVGVLAPVAGFLVDRVGPRKLMLFGWGVIGLGFLLMSRIDSLWAFYGTFVVVATGIGIGTNVVMNTGIANWFIKKRSRALAIIYVGPGLSGLIAPLFALSIIQLGWRSTLVIIAIALWVISIPLCSLFRHKPAQYGYLPDGDTAPPISETVSMSTSRPLGEVVKPRLASSVGGFTTKAALKTRAFWLLSFIFFLQQMGATAVNVHVVAYMESIKVSTTIAAIAMTGITLCSLIGRLGIGALGDFTSKKYLITLSLALMTTGIFFLSLVEVNKIWLLVLFWITFGAGFGAPIPLRPALQADYFGTRSFGTIMGLMMFIGMVGGLVSPVVAGWIFDVTGSYRWAWQLFTMLTLPAVPLMLLTYPPRVGQNTN